MDNTSYNTNDAVIQALEKYADMVRRICYLHLDNRSDVEDVFQDVFLKLLQSGKTFENDEHEKAWLCRVTINRCKDLSKSFFHTRTCSIDKAQPLFEDKIESDVMESTLSLPPKLKDIIYLFYYEDYTVPEIAKLLNKKENTIYSNLHRARKLLKVKLGGYESEHLF